MKYLVTESQFKKLQEFFNPEDENNIVGNPSENTLMIADFLLKQNIVEIQRMLILDDEIEIYGFLNHPLDYFSDNSVGFNVHTIDGDVHVNVVGKDDDNEGDDELRDQVYLYVQELAKQYPFINWYIEGARI